MIGSDIALRLGAGAALRQKGIETGPVRIGRESWALHGDVFRARPINAQLRGTLAISWVTARPKPS
jgi:hypothetical protein